MTRDRSVVFSASSGSSTNKTDHHDITEILLKVALSIIKQTNINIPVRFIFTSSCLWEGACLIYVICVCLCIVVSRTYCVVLCLVFLRLVCAMFTVSLECPPFLLLLRYSLMFIYFIDWSITIFISIQNPFVQPRHFLLKCRYQARKMIGHVC